MRFTSIDENSRELRRSSFFLEKQMLESKFKAQLIERIEQEFPDMDLDFIRPKSYDRSKPDIIILGPSGLWAALEVKRAWDSPYQPNQEPTIERMSKKGYAKFVFPENLSEVLDDLERLFTS